MRLLDGGTLLVTGNGAAGTGAVALANRSGPPGGFSDLFLGGKMWADAFMVLQDLTYNSTEADSLDATHALIGTIPQAGIIKQSVAVSAGHRVWVPFGATVGGATTQVLFNLAGVETGSANFTWDNSAKILTILGTAGASGVIAPLFNASGGGSSIEFQGSNFNVTGTGAFASNGWMDFGERAAPAAAGHQLIYADSSHRLMASLNGGSFLPFAFVPVSSNSQVMFSDGSALVGNSALTFAANILTITGGAGTGVIAPLFNANAGSTNIEFQGSNFNVTGQGAIATNGWLDFGQRAAPSGAIAAGHCVLYMDGTTHTLMLSTNGGAFGAIAGASVAGSTTQVQYNGGSGAFAASARFTFAADILTVGNGAGTGVSAPPFNGTAGSSNLEFQGSNFSVTGDGKIATNGWLVLGERATDPATTASQGKLYVSTSHNLRWSSNNGAFVDLVNAAGTYVGPGVQTQSAINGGAFGVWLSSFGSYGTFLQPYSGPSIQGIFTKVTLSGTDLTNVSGTLAFNGSLMATQDFVTGQGYATTTYVGSQGFATTTYVNGQGFETGVKTSDGVQFSKSGTFTISLSSIRVALSPAAR